MSKRYRVGELRPSQILFTYGIGAIADLPNLAVIVMGLEDWERSRTRELTEPRLLAMVQKRLGKQVKELRLPPLPEEVAQSPFDEAANIGIPVAPFPNWMVCPKCKLLQSITANVFHLKHNAYRPGETRYVHTNCGSNKAKQPPTVIPVRFLVACDNGHLDDFPWRYFVHRGNSDCDGCLYLFELGISGTPSDIQVKCEGCGQSRLLSDAFGSLGKQNMPGCRGRHPHLRDFDDSCNKQMKTILLGASNSWFSATLSALSIPKGSNKLAELVEKNWAMLGKLESQELLESLLPIIQASGQLQDFASFPTSEIWKAIEAVKQSSDNEQYRDLKTPEWEVFSVADTSKNNSDFSLQPTASPEGYEKYFKKTVLVHKLREVRALIGFTRIQSPGELGDIENQTEQTLAPISRKAPIWIPATEIRGEGIFLEFEEELIKTWENRPEVVKQGKSAKEAQKQWLNVRNPDLVDKVSFPGMRYILIHSFTHALMRQLTLECGYSAASLRERIYSQTPEAENGPQAGLLIYTAAPDSEGTLGGLVKLGEPKTLGYHINQALEQMKICTADPLCSEHIPDEGTPSLHWSACHSCLFAPETSCERGNKLLDRSVLVPTVAVNNLAFFKT
jgi:hypothetical protein